MRINVPPPLRPSDPDGVQLLSIPGNQTILCPTLDATDKFLTQLQNLLVEYTDQDLEVIEGDERGSVHPSACFLVRKSQMRKHTFNYELKGPEGERESVTIEAQSPEAAERALYEKGYDLRYPGWLIEDFWIDGVKWERG